MSYIFIAVNDHVGDVMGIGKMASRIGESDYETVPFRELQNLMQKVCDAYRQPQGWVCRQLGISPGAWSTWTDQQEKAGDKDMLQRNCYRLALRMMLTQKLESTPKEFTSDQYLFIAKMAKKYNQPDLAYKAMEGFLDGDD